MIPILLHGNYCCWGFFNSNYYHGPDPKILFSILILANSWCGFCEHQWDLWDVRDRCSAGERQVLCPVALPQLCMGSSPKVALTKQGFRGERRSPDFSMVLQRYQLSIRHPQGSHKGLLECELPLQAGGNVQEKTCFEKSVSWSLHFNGNFRDFSAPILCIISSPFGNCTSYLEMLLWSPFWVIYYTELFILSMVALLPIISCYAYIV